MLDKLERNLLKSHFNHSSNNSELSNCSSKGFPATSFMCIFGDVVNMDKHEILII